MPKFVDKKIVAIELDKRSQAKHSAAYLTVDQTVAITGISKANLAMHRSVGTGAPYIYSGNRRAYYAQEDLILWMAQECRFYADGSYGPDVYDNYANRDDPNRNPDDHHAGPPLTEKLG